MCADLAGGVARGREHADEIAPDPKLDRLDRHLDEVAQKMPDCVTRGRAAPAVGLGHRGDALGDADHDVVVLKEGDARAVRAGQGTDLPDHRRQGRLEGLVGPHPFGEHVLDGADRRLQLFEGRGAVPLACEAQRVIDGDRGLGGEDLRQNLVLSE